MGDVEQAVVHLERTPVHDIEARRRVLAVIEGAVVDPYARRGPDRQVVVRGVPVAARIVCVPLREAVIGVRERQVAHDHVVRISNPKRAARDAGVRSHADEGHIGADVLQRELRLQGGGGDTGVFEGAAGVDARTERGDVGVHRERNACAGHRHTRGDVVAREPRAVGLDPRVDGAADVHDARHLVVAGIRLRAAGAAGERVTQLLPCVHDIHLGRGGRSSSGDGLGLALDALREGGPRP